MKRVLSFLSLCLFLSACNIVQNQANFEVIPAPTVEIKQPDTKYIDSVFPSNLREKLENADDFEILSWLDYPHGNRIEKIFVRQFTIIGTKITKVNDKAKRHELLKRLYFDIADSEDSHQAACFIPRHTIKAKYKDEFIVIGFCYECGNFNGVVSKNQFGNKFPHKRLPNEIIFGGSFAHQEPTQSRAIIDGIINE